MPRPCQHRRTSAAANRVSKPGAPPAIRHKARQKAIHNARRGRGRGNMAGGRPPRSQQSGNGTEQDFISFSSTRSNFRVLKGTGSQHDPIAVDDIDDSELEEGELMIDNGSDSDALDDMELYDAEDMMINVQMEQPLTAKRKARRAQVMFTIPHAVSIYKGLWQARFPLPPMSAVRYGQEEGDTSSEPASCIANAPSPTSRLPSASSATTVADTEEHNPARYYVFDWGKHSGKYFLDAPESYLSSIGGQLDVYGARHLGLREAFEYHRPGRGRRRTAPVEQPRSQPQPAQPQPPAPRHRQNTRPNAWSPSETYTFTKGAHEGKKIHEVSEAYLRSIEGMEKVMDRWPGLREALRDFNKKTGRRSRV